MFRNDVPITPELVAQHGLTPDEYARFRGLIGREPTLTELGIVSAMWNEHCSYKSSRLHLRDAADHGALGDPGAGRERRRHRHRRRAGLRLQDGEPQPPELHRALPGRGDGRRRHPARRLHDGRAADRGAERAALRLARPSAHAPPRGRRRRGHRRLRQFLRRADGRRRRSASTRATTATSWSTPWRSASPAPTRSSTRPPTGVGNPIVYLGSKTGRDGIHGATMASAEFDDAVGGEAPDRAGRRPLRREAAAGGLPRADGVGRRHRHPGHGRGRPHLLGGRDGRQGRPRHRARPRRGADPRGRHDRLRDDAVGEPGAHAHGAQARHGGGGGGDLPEVGPRLRGHRPAPPTRCASSSSTAARRWPTCRSRSSATRRRSTTGRISPTPTSR